MKQAVDLSAYLLSMNSSKLYFFIQYFLSVECFVSVCRSRLTVAGDYVGVYSQ